MSLVRLLPAWLHAIADYAVALSLIAVALVVGGPGKAAVAGFVIGAVVLVVSLLTRYPLGLIKVLPFKVHSAGDYLAAALLVGSPFALGFTHSARGLTIFYIGAGVAVLLVSLVTNYQYSPKGQTVAACADPGRSERGQVQQTDAQADRELQPTARYAVPSYPSQVPPEYQPQAAVAERAPQEGVPQPVPMDQTWRTASWQTRALVDLPRANAPAFAPGPGAAAEPVIAEPVIAEPVIAELDASEPVSEQSSPDPAPQSRPLREILAERAVNKRSVA